MKKLILSLSFLFFCLTITQAQTRGYFLQDGFTITFNTPNELSSNPEKLVCKITAGTSESQGDKNGTHIVAQFETTKAGASGGYMFQGNPNPRESEIFTIIQNANNIVNMINTKNYLWIGDYKAGTPVFIRFEVSLKSDPSKKHVDCLTFWGAPSPGNERVNCAGVNSGLKPKIFIDMTQASVKY